MNQFDKGTWNADDEYIICAFLLMNRFKARGIRDAKEKANVGQNFEHRSNVKISNQKNRPKIAHIWPDHNRKVLLYTPGLKKNRLYKPKNNSQAWTKENANEQQAFEQRAKIQKCPTKKNSPNLNRFGSDHHKTILIYKLV